MDEVSKAEPQMDATPLKYGAISPNFSLQSTDGKAFTREQFRGNTGLVLVFFRDAEAITPLLEAIGQDAAEYAELGSRVFAIGGTSPEALTGWAATWSLPFTVLIDSEGRAWRAFAGAEEYAFAVFVLDNYGGVDAQKVVSTAGDLPDAARILQWATAAQFKCNI